MPTFTAVALDRLIEPGAAKSMALTRESHDSKLERRHSAPNPAKDRGTDSRSSNLERGIRIPPNPKLGTGVSVPPNAKMEEGRFDRRTNKSTTTSVVEKKHHWTQISPALYATPKTTPLPDSPSSFPPSPYIINHKRRGPRLMKSFSEDDVATCKPATDEIRVDDNQHAMETEVACVSIDDSCIPKEVEESAMDDNIKSSCPGDANEKYLNGICNDEHGSSDMQNGPEGQNGVLKSVAFNLQQDGEVDEFLDPQDSASVKSIGGSEGTGWEDRPLHSTTPGAEFYDAWEELSSESGPHPAVCDVETELHEIRLSLLMEIERRKQAEETLDNVRNQWQRIREQLSLVGLTLPADPSTLPEGEQPSDSAAYLCQQVYLARFVSNSIGRGTAKAEVEMEMEAQIKIKNFEIARLWDRLHYYEAVNQQMSQRNQEAIEMARRLRQRKKRRQKWVWSSTAAAISVGSAVLAFSYFQSGRGLSSESPSHAPVVDHKPN